MSSFYGTDIDSQPFVFQHNQRLRFNFGLELELSHALKSNTVYLANDKQLQRQRELDEAAAAEQGVTLSGVPDSGRRIVKLAHSPELSPQQQIDNFISETNLLKHLYLAGVPVPRLIAQVAANSLLCKDSDLRIPHPALMVLDYIDGISLKEAAAAGSLLERAGKVEQLWPQLLSIVAQLQQHQVIHRDLKPDQFLVKAGQPVLLDFDKASSADYRNTTVSHSPYAAPEVQAGSEHSSSDWYSLTAISFWLMTGHDPAPTGDLHAAEVFQPFRAFWQKGMAAEPQQRFSDLNALNTGFLQSLAAFKRELNPLDEAKARQQEWLERLQQHEQQIAALTAQQQSQVEELAALVEYADQAGVAFQQTVTALDAELQSCGHALDALAQQLKQQSTQLSVDLVDEATARVFLAQPWTDFANVIDNQRQQLTGCSSAERLLMLASQRPPVDFSAVIAKAAECQQQRQQLEQSLSTCAVNPSQQRLLSTLSRSQQNLDRQLSLLQNNATSALSVSSIADVLQQLQQQQQLRQTLELLLADYVQLSDELKFEIIQRNDVEASNNETRYSEMERKNNAVHINNNQRISLSLRILDFKLVRWDFIGLTFVVLIYLVLGSLSIYLFNVSYRYLLPFFISPTEVPFVHGFTAAEIKELQLQASKQLSKPVVFRDRLQNGLGYGPTMVVISAGTFSMGCSERDGICEQDERLGNHRVTHQNHFGVGKYAISFTDWSLCATQGGCSSNPAPGHSSDKLDQSVRVRWSEANDYVDWLSKATGHRYRLLSESEWEYSARAGTKFRLAQYGDCIKENQEVYDVDARSINIQCNSEQNYSSEVKDRISENTINAFGLSGFITHQLLQGEWVSDCYQPVLSLVPSDGTSFSQLLCQKRVVRGGVRVSGRTGDIEGRSIYFRVARDF